VARSVGGEGLPAPPHHHTPQSSGGAEEQRHLAPPPPQRSGGAEEQRSPTPPPHGEGRRPFRIPNSAIRNGEGAASFRIPNSAFRTGWAVALGGCTGPQHMLDTRGPHAAEIAGLWWIMFTLASLVVVVVTVLVVVAVARGLRRSESAAGTEEDTGGTINGRVLVWTGGVIVPLVVIFFLVVQTVRVGNVVYRPAAEPEGALAIDVIGHQYWWEVRYPQYGITTANEIYLPAGEPVRVRVSSPDVIHSFWVPQLQGKIDMIPGRVNALWLQADEPGLFRGACAEYCGEGHALMAFWVEAMPRPEFGAWLAHRRSPPPLPQDPQILRGREVFFEAQCHHCHAIPGAPLPEALGEVGPDLSDYGRRRTIAAGTRPNNAGTLAAWIANPQRMKPGARMPATHLEGERLDALLRYLLALR
jgi:cytochrome c oxidase subunit II